MGGVHALAELSCMGAWERVGGPFCASSLGFVLVLDFWFVCAFGSFEIYLGEVIWKIPFFVIRVCGWFTRLLCFFTSLSLLFFFPFVLLVRHKSCISSQWMR